MKTLPVDTMSVQPGRAFLATALIAAIWPLWLFAAAHAAEAATPQGAIAPAPGRVEISPAIQLPINAVPPIACAPATLGTLALDSRAHLCLCDGDAWKLANLDKPCNWKAAP
jgi:hypothetical protein